VTFDECSNLSNPTFCLTRSSSPVMNYEREEANQVL